MLHGVSNQLRKWGEQIAEGRKQSRYSQEQVSDFGGMSERTVREVEAGGACRTDSFLWLVSSSGLRLALTPAAGDQQTVIQSLADLGKFVQANREVSLRDLADISQVSRPTLSRLEYGEVVTTEKLAQVLLSLGIRSMVEPVVGKRIEQLDAEKFGYAAEKQAAELLISS